jgi:DNA topoisomerase III
VKTPTLAIVCLRELEIRNFRPEDYFEIAATANVAGGAVLMRHAPAARHRIKDRARAEAIRQAADNHRGPLTVSVEDCRQAPPKLFDLPALQKICGQRWGWTADRTLSVAQELYDGDGKKLITYPRAEARHLAENQIADVPAIAGALTRLRGFAHLDVSRPVIRRGKSGYFCDKALAGVSHHAVIPNVNVLDSLEQRLTRLDDDEKRLFAIICRSYLAAILPDYEYRQTIATLDVPVPGATAAEFRASGRIPLRPGWKAAYGAVEPDENPGEAEQTLPPLTDGETAVLTEPRIEAKRTQPPPRYNEGSLIDAMQNAWRFVEDPARRERLKEAKGIGTPATRAEIIKGLKRQNLLAADGKLVVPTEAGLQLFELLRGAAPALVDPGTTAEWEMQLDAILTGKANFMAVIDAIAAEANRLIAALQQKRSAAVRFDNPAPPAKRSGRKPRRGSGAPRKAKDAPEETRATGRRPTERMTAYARKLASAKKLELPPGYEQDFDACRRFLDQHA